MGIVILKKCDVCKKEYFRDYDSSSRSLTNHKTGRYCSVEECGGELVDTIINFGESLDSEILEKAWQHTNDCDLMLVLGSSCRVKPASLMPKEVGKNRRAKLVICNLQSTPVDEYATLKIGCYIDLLMGLVMQELNLEIPNFIVNRIIKVDYLMDWNKGEKENQEEEEVRVNIDGVDSEGVTASYLKSMVVLIGKKKNDFNT